MPKKAGKKPKLIKAASVRGLEDTYVPHADFSGIARRLFTSKSGRVNTQVLYDTVKASPEVNSCILAQVEDILADYWRFNTLSNSDKTNKALIKKAKDFEIKSMYFQKLTDAAWDAFVTGNGYILKLSVDKEKIKGILESVTNYVAKKFGAKVKKGDIFKLLKQEMEVPKDLQVLKSSTVKINYDKTGLISSYQQEVAGEKRIYKPDDIIHLGFIRPGGQPYSYTPLEPLLSDIGTLIFAKEFAGKYFENDGIPYFIFKMPEESPGGRNYKLLKKELRELKKKGEKYRSMVLTGNVEFDQVNKFNKDMEFAKLIEHFTQIIFMGMGVPATRVNFPVPKGSSAQAEGKREAGYYKRIAFIQKSWEIILNKELWNAFGVTMKFNRSYKIDEMREAEIIRILTEIGAITIEEARERIGMDPKIPKGTMAKPIGSDKRIDEEKDKKREQGIDQEPKNKVDNKLKMYKGFSDAILVSFSNFVMIAEGKIGPGNFTKAKVLYIETTTEFVLYFADEGWKYKTILDKKSMDVEQFRLEKLQFFVRIIP